MVEKEEEEEEEVTKLLSEANGSKKEQNEEMAMQGNMWEIGPSWTNKITGISRPKSTLQEDREQVQLFGSAKPKIKIYIYVMWSSIAEWKVTRDNTSA